MARRRGFTLLEVMVALAIAIPALILLYREGAVALELTGTAMATENAVSRAQSHLAALRASVLSPGDREGDDGGGFRWRVRIVPADTLAAGREGPGATLYDVAVAISWSAGRGPQSYTLATRMLGPAAAEAP